MRRDAGRRRVLLFPLLVVALVFLVGCSSISVTGAQSPTVAKGERVVIWGGNPEIIHQTTGWVQEHGGIVIERARLEAVLEEQQLRLRHTPDTDSDIFRVGRLVGADLIIFAENNVRSESEWASVSLRCVKVESGQVLWIRMAKAQNGIPKVNDLTNAALNRSR